MDATAALTAPTQARSVTARNYRRLLLPATTWWTSQCIQGWPVMPTVLCLGVPANATVGIDLACWQVGPKFQGICQVPTGPHYIYTGGDGVHGMRTGQFVVLEPDGSDVWVGRWDPVTEQLVVLSDEDEYNRYADGMCVVM